MKYIVLPILKFCLQFIKVWWACLLSALYVVILIPCYILFVIWHFNLKYHFEFDSTASYFLALLSPYGQSVGRYKSYFHYIWDIDNSLDCLNYALSK